MKPTNKDIKSSKYIPESLKEVWRWKESAYDQTKNMDLKKYQNYLDETMSKMFSAHHYQKVKNDDGSYHIEKIGS